MGSCTLVTKENVSDFQGVTGIICCVYSDDAGEEGEDDIVVVYRVGKMIL